MAKIYGQKLEAVGKFNHTLAICIRIWLNFNCKLSRTMFDINTYIPSYSISYLVFSETSLQQTYELTDIFKSTCIKINILEITNGKLNCTRYFKGYFCKNWS